MSNRIKRKKPMSDAVAVGYVHSHNVSYSWHHSLTRLLMFDVNNEQRFVRGGFVAMLGGTDGLAHSRNTAVRDFLADNTAQWLWWVDTDMGFDPDTVEQLIAVADPVERPVVGALCFAQRENDLDGMGGHIPISWPVVMDWNVIDGRPGFAVRWDYPRDAVTKCDGVGSACVLIHRSVFERMRDEYVQEQPGWMGWYSRVVNPNTGELVSEDLSFCVRLRKMGIPVHVNTAVKTTHHKPAWLNEDDYWRARALDAMLRKAAGPQAPEVDAATEKVAVIVPVLGRPQNAAPFMESLRETTDLATVYAVADTDDVDTIAAWEAVGATVVTGDAVTFPKKVNLGYQATSEPWILLVGDDVLFHAEWLDQAMHVAAEKGAQVVGTNDLGNPRVVRGEHATHMLVRRSYVDEVGASWDGPGVVCHEGYRHWSVDDEIVIAAKQRGAFASAGFSVIEHLHPFFGKADYDEVYRLGQSHAVDDRALFKSRLAANS